MQVDNILATKGSNVVTVKPTQLIREVLALLAQYNVGALVVTDARDRCVGIVSERDIVRHLATDGPSILQGPVSAIMTSSVQCARPQATTRDLMALMTDSRIRHVPVVDDEDTMIGIVSIGDVVKSRLGELEEERDALMQYVTIGG